MPADEVASLADKARKGGALSAPATSCPGPSSFSPPRELFSNFFKNSALWSLPSIVHLVDNLPPLPKRTVDLIVKGSFVEFALFPMLEDGPCEGEWRNSLGDIEGPGQSASARKKGVKEVPDAGWWGTCFTLFQAAWVRVTPEMFEPLSAYREIVARLARAYQWSQVAKYDRAFRKLAAGKGKEVWPKEEASLVRQYLSGHELKQAVGIGGPGQRKPDLRKKGSCFKFNKGLGLCTYGAQCRFLHRCAECGGEYRVIQCAKEKARRSPDEFH